MFNFLQIDMYSFSLYIVNIFTGLYNFVIVVQNKLWNK